MNKFLQVLAIMIAYCASLSRKGTRFASVIYTNKEGETSKYVILLGVDYSNCTRASLAIAKLFTPKDKVESQAKVEVIESLTETLNAQAEGRTHKDYTCADTYQTITNGIKAHKEEGVFYVSGLQIQRKVITPGTYKEVKSRPLTLAKNAILRNTPRAKWRQFKLTPEQMESVKIGGRELTME